MLNLFILSFICSNLTKTGWISTQDLVRIMNLTPCNASYKLIAKTMQEELGAKKCKNNGGKHGYKIDEMYLRKIIAQKVIVTLRN